MARFHLPPESWQAAPRLTGDEARHLSQVLRIKAGEIVTIFDGKGRRSSARVTQVSREEAALELIETLPSPVSRPRITLAQAIPKGKNMDLIVQKAVELGVAAIHPIVTKNTIVQPGEGKASKWRRNALEACKQCGQDTLPDIPEPVSFENWLSHQAPPNSLKIIASLAIGARPLREILRVFPACEDVSLLVGPEGDFTPAETQAAIDAGFQAASLGNIVLRVETATIFCLSALRYQFD